MVHCGGDGTWGGVKRDVGKLRGGEESETGPRRTCRNGEMRGEGRELPKPREEQMQIWGQGQGQMSLGTETVKNG